MPLGLANLGQRVLAAIGKVQGRTAGLVTQVAEQPEQYAGLAAILRKYSKRFSLI